MATATKNRIPKPTSNGTHPEVETDSHISIRPPNFQVAKFCIRGTAPYVQNKFSAEDRRKMHLAHEEGEKSRKNKKKEPKDFKKCYEGSLRKTADGWFGIPAPAFRNGMIDACRMVGFTMTHAKCSLFIVADGYDADDGMPLVKITKGKPAYYEVPVVNDGGSPDLRARGRWDEGWEAEVSVRFNADQFTVEDVANLLMWMGISIGVGAGRPFSKDSPGTGCGTFELLAKGN